MPIDGAEKRPCLECKIFKTGRATDNPRCKKCPDLLDYLLKIQGKETFHRGFNPHTPGFEPYDPLAPIEPEKETPKKTPKKKTEHIICKGPCGQQYPLEAASQFFYKAQTSTGYMGKCKKCFNQYNKERKQKEREEKKKKRQTPDNEPSPDNKPSYEHIKKTCNTCETVFNGEKEIKENFGSHNMSEDGFSKSCKKCVSNQKREEMDKYLERKKKIIPIDFNSYPELLRDLTNEAQTSYRNIDQQIMFVLEKYLKGEK